MSNTEQIQKMATVIEAFAKTSEVPFQNPGEFHAKFFDYMYSNANEDGTVFIIALRDVIFANVNPRTLPDVEKLHSTYDSMISDWERLMADVRASLPTVDDVLDSMFYPMMLPKFFERTLCYCGIQYLVGV